MSVFNQWFSKQAKEKRAEAKRLTEQERQRQAEEAEAKRQVKELEAKRQAEEAEAKRLVQEARVKRRAEKAESKQLAEITTAKHLSQQEATPKSQMETPSPANSTADSLSCPQCKHPDVMKMDSGQYWCSWCNDWARICPKCQSNEIAEGKRGSINRAAGGVGGLVTGSILGALVTAVTGSDIAGKMIASEGMEKGSQQVKGFRCKRCGAAW